MQFATYDALARDAPGRDSNLFTAERDELPDGSSGVCFAKPKSPRRSLTNQGNPASK